MVIRIGLLCLFGYFGGRVAAHKGYAPVSGVVAGILLGLFPLFLGILAFLAVVALLPRTRNGRAHSTLEAQLNREAAVAEKRQRCPECGREVSLSAWVCPRCSYHFQTEQKAA
jgi:ribosomal protein S27AE